MSEVNEAAHPHIHQPVHRWMKLDIGSIYRVTPCHEKILKYPITSKTGEINHV
jgi:hypothetical protein